MVEDKVDSKALALDNEVHRHPRLDLAMLEVLEEVEVVGKEDSKEGGSRGWDQREVCHWDQKTLSCPFPYMVAMDMSPAVHRLLEK